MEPFIRRWKGDELITPAVGPHAAYTCSEETLLKAKEIADRHDAMIHIHLSETREEVDGFLLSKGKSPVEYLDSLGMLNERLAAVHCVWLSPEDCYLLAERKANVVSCTVSNLKLTSGIAPLNTMMKADVNVCLGTDGASSNNNLSLFEEMKTTAIVQKNAYHTPAAFSAEQIWRLATENACAGLPPESGAASGRSGRPGPDRPEKALVLPRDKHPLPSGLQHGRRRGHNHRQRKGAHARGSHTGRGGDSGEGSGALPALDLLASLSGPMRNSSRLFLCAASLRCSGNLLSAPNS